MITHTITLTHDPDFHYSATGMAICSFVINNQRYVAFDALAESMGRLAVKGTTITITGYKKPRGYRDSKGYLHSRDDFIIKRWEEA